MILSYDDALSIIRNAEKAGSIMDVETMRELMEHLGNPQDKLRIIHIAGTNGKGSTLAMISTILTTAGCRVGRYISPTLVTYLERIQIDGAYISETEFAEVMGDIADALNTMKSSASRLPTSFELETAAAFLYFHKKNVDFVVLETGLGGEYDATNVCSAPLCCVFTSIGLDHMGILGSTLPEIASVKAGIVMPGTTVVTTVQDSGAMEVLEQKCQSTGSRLIVSDYTSDASDIRYAACPWADEGTSYTHARAGQIALGLAGTYQIINSCLAISCVEALMQMGYKISYADVRAGIKATKWFGRLSLIGSEPPFFVDGAHNEPAARQLRSSVLTYFTPQALNGRRLVYIMGVFADKDYEKIIELMLPMADHIFTIETPGNRRAMPADELAGRINKKKNIATACRDITDAVEQAVTYNNGDVAVLAFGSLSHLNQIREAYEEWTRKR